MGSGAFGLVWPTAITYPQELLIYIASTYFKVKFLASYAQSESATLNMIYIHMSASNTFFMTHDQS